MSNLLLSRRRALTRLSALPFMACLAGPAPAATRAYAEREDVRAFIADMQARHGFDEAELVKAFQPVQMDPQVIKLILPAKSPAQRSWKRYRGRFVEPIRIAGGVEYADARMPLLLRAQEQYGVPPEIVVAIVGVETIYGRNIGNFQTLSALATLAFDYPPRAELFRDELEALFLLAREQGTAVDSFVGSYAGALGPAQFLPSSWRRYGVDFDADGRVDMFNSEPDILGSVARYLRDSGWAADEPVAVPASVQQGTAFRPLIDAGIEPRFRLAALQEAGVKPAEPATDDLPCALIDLVTPGQPTEYWLGYRNFYAITRYNRSSFYAMSVFQLARAIRTEWDKKSTGAKTGKTG
ncbi:MAG: lytic murein transglycosylase B [Rhodocyclaceae bacterium]|nr:lytic murein transglycosylase B [Rhodocyclaceae bacterium]MBX3669206.1 lytic murein transglycosylase B [Rhodocyclaceae bacterium]